MKQQVLYINGGVPKENYNSYYDYLESIEYDPYKENVDNWSKTLGDVLGDNSDFLKPPYPETFFADYQAWKIIFEKVFPYLSDEVCIIANSLGGAFILKYLGENRFPQKIKKLFFTAPGWKTNATEKLGSFEFDINLAAKEVQKQVEQIYIYHSRDDDVVPFEQSVELKKHLPSAIFREFTDREHFYKELRLPELEADVKN